MGRQVGNASRMNYRNTGLEKDYEFPQYYDFLLPQDARDEILRYVSLRWAARDYGDVTGSELSIQRNVVLGEYTTSQQNIAKPVRYVPRELCHQK